MKIYDIRKKDGTSIHPYIDEWNIYHNGIPILDEFKHMTDKDNILNIDSNHQFSTYAGTTGSHNALSKYEYSDIGGSNKVFDRNSVLKNNGLWFLSTDKCTISHKATRSSTHFFQIDRTANPICLFRDTGSTIISNFGFNYQDLSQMLNNGDYSKYIKDNDYIELVIDGYLYTMRFNIDMYYDYSFTSPYSNNKNNLKNNIPHHIDMISDEIMPESMHQYLNIYDKSVGNLMSIAGNTKTRDSGILNLYQSISEELWNTYSPKLSSELRNSIIEKYCRIGDRSTSDMTRSINNMSNVPIGRFWQPREPEIFGQAIISQRIYEASVCMQYSTFKFIGSSRREASTVGNPKGGKYKKYVTWSLQDGNINPIIILENGIPKTGDKTTYEVQNLLCFRFA